MTVSIRGACPSLAAPMQTGDGLLVRLIPHEPIDIAKLCSLCTAAEEHGNGIIEITQRGSLQIRGLHEGSVRGFARSVASLEIGTAEGPPLVTSPLLGLDPDEPFDCTAFVSSVRTALHRLRPNLESLGPKVTVLIDAGGQINLDAVSADIRLVATAGSLLQLSIAGNGRTATHLGYVANDPGRATASVENLLWYIANLGPAARAKDLTGDQEISKLRSTLCDSLIDGPAPKRRSCAETVGVHRLISGKVARGFSLPFGHTTAGALRRFARAAADNGAPCIRPAPGRCLLAIGLSPAAADRLCETAIAEDFIVDAHDLRRNVVACAGAPACACAELATRELAPEIARAIRKWAGTRSIVHLSGCSKGCAHPGPAALTLVGPNRLIVNGRASDAPQRTISSAGVIADIERLCSEL
ncbi:MAG: precorrin-3B synthase [Steroidobacteraceae bacterium]